MRKTASIFKHLPGFRQRCTKKQAFLSTCSTDFCFKKSTWNHLFLCSSLKFEPKVKNSSREPVTRENLRQKEKQNSERALVQNANYFSFWWCWFWCSSAQLSNLSRVMLDLGTFSDHVIIELLNFELCHQLNFSIVPLVLTVLIQMSVKRNPCTTAQPMLSVKTQELLILNILSTVLYKNSLRDKY